MKNGFILTFLLFFLLCAYSQTMVTGHVLDKASKRRRSCSLITVFERAFDKAKLPADIFIFNCVL